MGDNTHTLYGCFSPAQFVGRRALPMAHFSGERGRCIVEHRSELSCTASTAATKNWARGSGHQKSNI